MENVLTPKQIKPAYKTEDSGIGLVAYIVIQFLLIELAAQLIKSGVGYSLPFQYIIQFLIEAVFAVAVIIICSYRRLNIVLVNHLDKKISAPLVALCIGVSLVVLFGLGDVSTFFMQLLEAIGYKGTNVSIKIDSFGKLIIYTIVLAATPAFCEELLFRGLMIGSLSKFGREFAVFISAISFTLMHGSPDQTVHQFILGVICGYIFYFTANLWLTMIIHFLNNFIVLAVNFFYQVTASGAAVMEKTTTTSASVGTLILHFAISAVIVGVSVYLIILLIKQISKRNYEVNKTLPDYFNESDKKYVEGEIMAADGGAEGETNKANDLGADTAVQVDAQPSEIEVEGEKANNAAETDMLNELVKTNEKRKNSAAFTILICANAYLILEWILALVEGFKR